MQYNIKYIKYKSLHICFIPDEQPVKCYTDGFVMLYLASVCSGKQTPVIAIHGFCLKTLSWRFFQSWDKDYIVPRKQLFFQNSS